MAHLIVCRGERFERVLELARDVVTVGADPDADHRLAEPAIPRGVATFARADGAWTLAAPAALGVRVDGKPATRAALEHGARVELGPFTLHVVLPARQAGEERRHRTMDALFGLAESVHAAVGRAGLLDGIMDSLLKLFDAERGFILRQEPGKPELVPAVARKVDLAHSDRFSHTVASEVLASGRAKLIRDTSVDERLRGQESIIAAQIRSIVAAPLLRGPSASAAPSGTPVGVIYLDVRTVERQFDEEDLALLSASAVHVLAALDNSSERERLSRRAENLQEVVEQEVRREYDPRAIVGGSRAQREVLELVARVAPQDTTVLVTGESGTGKELIARALHDLSPRNHGPFVAVNCTALSPALLESELFGHERGAFTGAHERRQGRFELAQGGTLFLDEIGELAPQLQVKLLRVLQERTIERVGSATPHAVDVRLVCATHVDLKRAVAGGQFRQDLYYRVAVFPVRVPPLRERREDIPALVRHFVLLFRARMGRRIDGVEPDALQRLVQYAWPGNVRELRNVIERAFVVEQDTHIGAASLPFDLGEGAVPAPAAGTRRPALGTAREAIAGPPPRTLAVAREEFERELLLECLRRHGGRVAAAARELDIPRSTIYRKLESWGIPTDGKGD